MFTLCTFVIINAIKQKSFESDKHKNENLKFDVKFDVINKNIKIKICT